MGYVKPTETDQLTLPSDGQYWVKIKKRATRGDEKAARTAMLQLRLDQESAAISTQVQWGAYSDALTISMVVEWNVTDEGGQILPISIASLDSLTSEDGDFIDAAVRERSQTRAVEQERPFALPLSKP